MHQADNRWKNAIKRSFRLSPTLLMMIEEELRERRISFSNYMRQSATAFLRHGRATRRRD